VAPTPDPDFQLLHSDPKGLVMAYQGMIESIVWKFVKSGMFAHESIADVVQTVNMELLERIDRIQANFNGSTLVRTYVSAVIRNICLKLHRQGLYGKPTDPVVKENTFFSIDAVDRYSIEQARGVFRAILRQYHRDMPKLTVCLKLHYHIGLERKDIMQWYPECSPNVVAMLISQFGGEPVRRPEKEMYALVTPVFNAAEQKSNLPDAVRRWTGSKILEILTLLNSSIPPAAFDDKSLRLLVEDYYSPFLLKE
jgi:hypothetical protein